ncbi:hypothetical protein NQ315_003963 [Exocentrus adspersus]|uniref:Uncharacterized protein n=1 Tax=Exocentrus adspersus TaxID=1586481 RepID=A0AAV8V9W0_9CUCU|nr:hypothetical protein NQ315_003963 [Exocentrus adspersus]
MYKEQEKQLKRGDRISMKKQRFGEKKIKPNRLRRKERNVPKKRSEAKVKQETRFPIVNRKSLVETNREQNNMFPFRGTTSLIEGSNHNEEIDVEKQKYNDSEWSTTACNVIQFNNALSSLMGAYASDDEFDPIDMTEKDNEKKYNNIPDEHVCTSSNDNNEPPTEMKIISATKSSKINESQRQSKRNISIITCTSVKASNFHLKKRKVTLLEKLLKTEIIQERNCILQCIRYVVNKNFFM